EAEAEDGQDPGNEEHAADRQVDSAEESDPEIDPLVVAGNGEADSSDEHEDYRLGKAATQREHHEPCETTATTGDDRAEQHAQRRLRSCGGSGGHRIPGARRTARRIAALDSEQLAEELTNTLVGRWTRRSMSQ